MIVSTGKEIEITTIEDGMMLDYLTNNPIKETPKELVRQKTLRALFHEYGISADDIGEPLTERKTPPGTELPPHSGLIGQCEEIRS
ncbi:MAG: hypothetical protein AAF431_14215 [Pseudomonadota bacterium]